MQRATLIVTAFMVGAVAAESPPESRRNFVSCPIVRDTATVPCWLSEHDGELYYLGIQTDVSADFDPPFLGHDVLVEGVVSDQPRICGGIVLDPVRVSPLAEFNANCNTILPAEDRFTVPFAPRPPGPSGGRLAFERPPREAEVLLPPYEPREFLLHYDFDMLIMGRHAARLGDILEYAEAIDATRITIVGYSGATLLSNGQTMTEDGALAEKRAREVSRLLSQAGLHEVSFSIDTATLEPSPDGIDDWMSRRVSVVVAP